jgi:hypothetical protein
MDDSFHINKYFAGCLIALGIGQILDTFIGLSIGMTISILGIAGLIIFSKPDKYLIISLFIWAIGIQFVISHWPYGRIIVLSGGILTMVSLFLRYSKSNFSNYKLWILISLLELFCAYYLKLMHSDYYQYFLFIGSLSLIISYGLRFVKKKPKQVDDYLKLIFIFSYLIFYLFRVEHYPWQKVISLIVIASTWSLGGFILFKELNAKKN